MSTIHGTPNGVQVSHLVFDGQNSEGLYVFRPVTTTGQPSKSTYLSLTRDAVAQVIGELTNSLDRFAVVLKSKSPHIPFAEGTRVRVSGINDNGEATEIEGEFPAFEGLDVNTLPPEVPTHPDTTTLNQIKDILK